jgi:hypothetical protein
MTDRKLRHTLSAAAWIGTLLWALALLSTASAAVYHARAIAGTSTETQAHP